MAADLFRDTSKGITDLAKEVTASESVWTTFKKDPKTYAANWAKKNNTVITLDDAAVTKIKGTTYAEAVYKFTTVDLSSTSGLW